MILTSLLIGGAIGGVAGLLSDNSDDIIPFIRHIDAEITNENYLHAIKSADNILKLVSNSNRDSAERIVEYVSKQKQLAMYLHGVSLYDDDYDIDDEENNESREWLQRSDRLLDEIGSEYGWDECVRFRSMLLSHSLDKFGMARKLAISLLSAKGDFYSEARDIYDEMTDILKVQYHNFDMNDRKYMFLVDNMSNLSNVNFFLGECSGIDVFELRNLPESIIFPDGRPSAGLYRMHPIRTNEYYPSEGFEDRLFKEKIREFCSFSESLGADSIQFHSLKGLSVDLGMSTSKQFDADAKGWGVGLSGSYSRSKNSNESLSNNEQIELSQTFVPNCIRIPENLSWLQSDPDWQVIIKQRLRGSIKERTFRISTSQMIHTDENESMSIKAGVQSLKKSLNANYSSEKDTTFDCRQENEWSIHVTFAQNLPQAFTLLPVVQIEDVSDCWSGPRVNLQRSTNGLLCVGDRVLIETNTQIFESSVVDIDEETIALNNNICAQFQVPAKMSLICGMQLNETSPESSTQDDQLTESEEEYVSLLKELLKDGTLGPRERKLLEKYRGKSGISVQRAKVLEESLTVVNLTDDEKEYLEAYKDGLIDGSISDKDRKFLERLRKVSGISEARAQEIEQMA